MSCKWLLIIGLFCGCRQKITGSEIAAQYLEQKNLVPDNTIKVVLDSILPGVNCLIKQYSSRYFVVEEKYNSEDTNQVLLILFRKKMGTGVSSGFSDISKRCVFICPLQIKEFVEKNSLSDTADIEGYLSLILLHEFGHFMYKVPGNYDEGISIEKTGSLGEQDLGLSPEVMTTNKKKELQVDSLAIEMVRKGSKIIKGNCFDISFKVEMAVNGAEFMLFGERLLEDYGSQTPDFIKDHNWTHPNIELRLAFMNYYLNPTEEKRAQIDSYLYNREIAPVNRQLTDPRIYQGNEKILEK